MKNRIREIRNHYKLSQEEFGKRLGVSRGVIVNAELGRSEQSPLFFDHLCKEYHVDRHWLETGKGEMLVKTESWEKLLEGLPEEQKELIRGVMSLPPEMQQSFLNIMRNVSKEK